MAHKLASMRLHDQNLTQASAVVRILAMTELEPKANRRRFTKYVSRRVAELWDGQPTSN